MSKLIRVSFVIIAILAHSVSVWIFYENELLMISLFIFGLIANILCCAPIQIEMEKRREPPALPLLLLALPFILWYYGVGTYNFFSLPFLHFFGMSLFLVNVSGFLLGLALSPVISMVYGGSDPRAEEHVEIGKKEIRKSGFLPFMLCLLAGVTTSLYFASDLLVTQMLPFSDLLFYISIVSLFFFGLVIIRLTYRSSIWGDPQLYGFYSHKIMKDYLDTARPEED